MSGQNNDGATVVIGAGLSGLWLTRALRRDLGRKVILLEASRRSGGRIHTVYDSDGTIKYESGAWRVPVSHKRVISLFEETGVSLRRMRTSPPCDAASTVGKERKPFAGLSTWEVTAARAGNPLVADLNDLETGYADETYSDSTTTPYLSDAPAYMVSDEGFSELVRRLTPHDIEYDTRVLDILPGKAQNSKPSDDGGEACVIVQKRDQHGLFTTQMIRASTVFVCVPPHAIRKWSTFAAAVAVHLSRVESSCLNHIYAPILDERRKHLPPTHSITPHSLLAQTVDSQYDGSSWTQLSYSGGRVARFWERLRQVSQRLFLIRLASLVSPMYVTITDAVSHFWEHAYHRWVPVRGFCETDAVSCGIQPNPVAYPNVWTAGESHSSHQAWMEGALETAQLAYQHACHAEGVPLCQRTLPAFPKRAPTRDEMVFEGRILDVVAFAEVHPGGRHAIMNHLGEDISALFRHIGHSENATAILAGMQVAWEDK